MKKLKKVLLLILVCYVSYYVMFGVLSLTELSQKTIASACCVFYLLPIPIFIIISKIIKKENEEVTKVSLKIQNLIQLNEKYNFVKVKKNRKIFEREFSRKSLDRVTRESILKYHLENNIDSFRTDIENAINDLKKLDNYNKELEKISSFESKNESNYSFNKFKKIENRVFESLIHKKDEFMINLKIEVNYRSSAGRVNISRYGKCSFEELVNIYKQWQNGRKYEETKKQERKMMNDDIRYNVLKRDNYTCCICGATAKDGAKLEVDHIIPVSKGGKTIMSNLQTLCDRCNKGKSNKTDNFFDNFNNICPKCGGKLVKRKGKYGIFIGCSNYPECLYKYK